MKAFEKLSRPRFNTIKDVVNGIIVELNIEYDFQQYVCEIEEDPWGYKIVLFSENHYNLEYIFILIHTLYSSNDLEIFIRKRNEDSWQFIDICNFNCKVNEFNSFFDQVLTVILNELNNGIINKSSMPS